MLNTVAFIFCFVFQEIIAQAPNSISPISSLVTPYHNQDELQQILEKFKDKDKFSSVLDILKSALSEEIENSQNKEDNTQETVLNNLNSLVEDRTGEDELDIMKNLNETKAKKAFYKKVVNKITQELTKNDNSTNHQDNTEIPNMIPIFKPRNAPLAQNIVDCTHPKVNQNPKPVNFVPEKIVQTNLNLIPNRPMFNIPCQRAADVLDMTNVPELCGNPDVKTHANLNPKTTEVLHNFPNQPPVTLSVNCAEADDTVAVLFKPKAISLMQLYGNLLKNITITVLVPYHMAKLGTN